MLPDQQEPTMSSLFNSPPGGPGELEFRLGAIPVRIQPWFWLTSFVLAGPWFNTDPRPWPVVMFVMACLVSILWHELGHAWAMQCFGARHVEIVLTGFGGYASTHSRAPRAWQRIAIALAGPANQLAAWAVMFLAVRSGIADSLLESSILADLLLAQLMMINLLWPLVNLMPIFPLDGGRVTRELGVALLGTRGLKASLLLSIGLCGLFILWVVSSGGSMFNALLFGLLLAQNLQELQLINESQRYHDRGDWRS
jgi:Zn-dependent protease